MDRELEILANRTTALLAGIYGFTDDQDGRQVVRVGGSAIFVAPYQALTARHVCRDLFRTDPNRSDALHRKTQGYFYLPHGSGMFQVASRRDETRSVIWSVTRTWDPAVTDICFMEAVLDSDASSAKGLSMPTTFFEWALEPPGVGETVVMMGFPKTDITVVDGRWNLSITCIAQKANVVEVHEERRDAGMYSFPCFAVDQAVDHGCSGGPVLWHNRLCGIVSGGSVDDRTYVASLWPLTSMEYEYPDLGALGGKSRFGDLLERGVIRSTDWSSVKSRVCRRYDDNGRPFTTLRKPA